MGAAVPGLFLNPETVYEAQHNFKVEQAWLKEFTKKQLAPYKKRVADLNARINTKSLFDISGSGNAIRSINEPVVAPTPPTPVPEAPVPPTPVPEAPGTGTGTGTEAGTPAEIESNPFEDFIKQSEEFLTFEEAKANLITENQKLVALQADVNATQQQISDQKTKLNLGLAGMLTAGLGLGGKELFDRMLKESDTIKNAVDTGGEDIRVNLRGQLPDFQLAPGGVGGLISGSNTNIQTGQPSLPAFNPQKLLLQQKDPSQINTRLSTPSATGLNTAPVGGLLQERLTRQI